MQAAVTIRLKDLKLERARFLWSKRFNGGVSMANAALVASVEKFCNESVSSMLSMLEQDEIRESPDFIDNAL